MTCWERSAARGRPGECSSPRVLRSDARLRFVITTSNSEPLQRPFTSAQYCSHDYQMLLRRHGVKVSSLMHVNMHRRAVDER